MAVPHCPVGSAQPQERGLLVSHAWSGIARVSVDGSEPAVGRSQCGHFPELVCWGQAGRQFQQMKVQGTR